VVTYDRRGYSRSQVVDPDRPVTISDHGDDLQRLIADLASGPVSIFGTSFGALIVLDLAARAPELIDVAVVHEPPLGQLLVGEERRAFDVNLDAAPDAGSALDALAGSIGVVRGQITGGTRPRREVVPADVELFMRRDVPAIGEYSLDLDQLRPAANRIVMAGSEQARDFYPYWCAQRLAAFLDVPFREVPGNHAGMIQHPAEFADRLRKLLSPSTRDAQ
jgi:pimeloyl-ACP methyl ester carboxylesterase